MRRRGEWETDYLNHPIAVSRAAASPRRFSLVLLLIYDVRYFFRNRSTPRLQSSVMRVMAFSCTPASSAVSNVMPSM